MLKNFVKFKLLVLILLKYGKCDWNTDLDIPGLSPFFDPYEDSVQNTVASLSNPSMFRFSGMSGQYLQFPVWFNIRKKHITSFASSQILPTLSFDFLTRFPSSLLVYSDDGGDSSFISLMLNDGALQLRFKFGRTKTVCLRSGSHLNDNKWHTVVLTRDSTSVTLSIDGDTKIGVIEEAEGLKEYHPRSYTYFGGLKKSYRLQTLSLPGITKVAKFIGVMRRISVNGKFAKAEELLGIQEETADRPCPTDRNPCLNNGKCYEEDGKAACDCSYTNYMGDFCETTYEAAVASFRGSEWISYDIRSRNLASFIDQITLSFRTTQPNGLLLHTGRSGDYVTLALRDGFILLIINLGAGAYEVLVEHNTFSDGRWHSVAVNRTLRQIEIAVDRAILNSHVVEEDYSQLTLNDVIYVGGSPYTASLPGMGQFDNFIGCLREVTYFAVAAETVWIPLSRLARDGDPSVEKHGNITSSCNDVENSIPVQFNTPQSLLVAPGWKNTLTGTIKFTFKTTEQDGLLIYTSSAASDLLAVEIYRRNLYVVVNLGSGISRFLANSSVRLTDGKWHPMAIIRNGKDLTITVHDVSQSFQITGSNNRLDTTQKIFVGGADFLHSVRPAPGLWTAPLRQGFVGCIKDLKIDNSKMNLQALTRESGATSADDIMSYCSSSVTDLCSSQPCKNGAACTEGMNRFICDCSATSFTGPTCEKAVVLASFDGTQFLTFPMNTTIQTEAEEISLRFKTSLSTGLLFATTSNTTRDGMVVELIKGGIIRLSINIGDGPDQLLRGAKLNDGKWHRVRVSRRGRGVRLGVDGSSIGKQLSGRHNKLEFDVIHLGKLVRFSKKEVRASANSFVANVTESNSPFVGYLENVVFNLVHLIDECESGKIFCKSSSIIGSNDFIVAFPATFEGENSYAQLPTLNAYRSMDLFLSVRSTGNDGLILYNGGSFGDYIAIEIVYGIVHYVYNVGNEDQVIFVPNSNKVNDNQWHDIRITRDENNKHSMTVDDASVSKEDNGKRKNFDLDGILYVGGVTLNLFHNQSFSNRITSREGFRGCLGNLDLNGKTINIFDSNQVSTSGVIRRGCNEPANPCRLALCANGGICLQQWNLFACDCSLTAYVGQRCQQHISAFIPEAKAYRFGPNKGVVLYQWMNSYPSQRRDRISLGFSTTQRNALLMRVTGSVVNGIQNFLEITIDNGRVKLRFNIGSYDVVLAEPRIVADGQYHTCVVERKCMNATMRIDNRPEQRNFTTDQTRTVFSSQKLIQIGGLVDENTSSYSRKKRTPSIRKAFRGQMAGFYFNKVRVFELAQKDDNQVKIIGDIQLIRPPASTEPTITSMVYTTTSATTMLTSSSVTTTTTTTTSSSINLRESVGCDDLELCSSGSGSGSGELEYDEDVGSGFSFTNPSSTASITSKKDKGQLDATVTTKTRSLLKVLSPWIPWFDFVRGPGVSSRIFVPVENYSISDDGKYVDELSEIAFEESKNFSHERYPSSVHSRTRTRITPLDPVTNKNDFKSDDKSFSTQKRMLDGNKDNITPKERRHREEFGQNIISHSDINHGELIKVPTASVYQQAASALSSVNATTSVSAFHTEQKELFLRKENNSLSVVVGNKKHSNSHFVNETTLSSTHRRRDNENAFTITSFASQGNLSPNKIRVNKAKKANTAINTKHVITRPPTFEARATKMQKSAPSDNTGRSPSVAPASAEGKFKMAESVTFMQQVYALNLSFIHNRIPSEPMTNLSNAFGNFDLANLSDKGKPNEWGNSIVAETPPEKSRTQKVNLTLPSSLDVPPLFTENNTGSGTIVLAKTLMSKAAVAGIVAAASIIVLCIILIMYAYRRRCSRSSDYDVKEQERIRGLTQTNGKHIYVQANGKVIKSNNANGSSGKEVYV